MNQGQFKNPISITGDWLRCLRATRDDCLLNSFDPWSFVIEFIESSKNHLGKTYMALLLELGLKV